MTNTTQISGATGKRSAGEQEEEKSASVKKSRIENEGSESEESEDMEYEYVPEYDENGKEIIRGQVKSLVEPVPEWDVDSYDGFEYESEPELREEADEEAYLKYRNGRIEALKHRGFEPDLLNGIYPIMNLDKPEWPNNETNREYMARLANLCVQKLNEGKGKTVELVSVERGTITVGGWWKVYITFMAREYPDGPLVEYQAKAMDYVGGGSRTPLPILCRPVNP